MIRREASSAPGWTWLGRGLIAATLVVGGAPLWGTSVEVDASRAVKVTQAEMTRAPDAEPPTPHAPWLPVDLPHRWGRGVSAGMNETWYRLTVDVTQWSGAELAVYLPRIAMNADLWINGRFADRVGSMEEPLTRHWNTPLLLKISPLSLRAGDNDVLIRVRALDGHDGGLAPISLGTVAVLEPIAERARFWRGTLVNALATCVFALAFVVLVVWARRPARVDYLYFSLGAIGCAVSSLNMSVTSPPMSDAAWEMFVHVCLHAGVVCLALFGWQFAGLPTQRKRWLLAGVLAVDVLVQLALDGAAHRAAIGILSLVVLAIAAVALLPLVRKLRQHGLTDLVVFGLAALLAVGFGVHDWLVVSALLPFESAYALPYVWPILLGAFSWLIAGEYARTQRDLARLNADLLERVAARESALRQTYEQLRVAERAQASAEERARVLRDIHDGVGAHLAMALRAAESGDQRGRDVVHTLRESLDGLKLAIDGMTLPAGDVTALLAALRYRLGPRLSEAGLAIEWDVQELPTWPGGVREGGMRDLQFLLFEIVSNVLQHARAKSIAFAARASAHAIELEIADDGTGVAGGTELRSCTLRARAIGAALTVDACAPGTRVRLRLPLVQIASDGGHTHDRSRDRSHEHGTNPPPD
jgi:hypothetical protein